MKFLKEGFRSATIRLPTMFVRCTTVSLPIKALLLKIYIYLNVMRSFYSRHDVLSPNICSHVIGVSESPLLVYLLNYLYQLSGQ